MRNNENGKDNLVVYVYDGDYLKASLHEELISMSKEMSSNWFAINHVRNSDSSIEDCQKHVVQVVWVPRHFSIIDALHDPKSKFKYVSTIGGMVVNRQMERKSYKMDYVNTSYSLFSFYMALFCQSFRNEFKFNLAPLECVECVDSVGRVGYNSKFAVCGDGHVHCTMS